MTAPRTPVQNLGLIQASMLAGPLLLVGVSYFVHHQPGYSPLGVPAGIQYALPILCLIALGGVLAVRSMRSSVTEVQRYAFLSLIGWAIAEAAALAGALYYFMTDDPKWAATGIFVMLFGALMLPAKRPD